MSPTDVHSTAELLVKRQDLQHSRKEILYDGYFYDVTDFVDRHPGGKLINFYTIAEEDATQAIQQFHFRSKGKVSTLLKTFKRRSALPHEFFPDEESQQRYQNLTDDFAKLYRELESEGFMNPSIPHVVSRALQVTVLGVLSFYLATRDNFYVQILGGFFLGIFGGQCGWIQHEAGHNSLTGIPRIDKLINSFVWAFCLGGSSYWWNSVHNRHHAMPQRLHRDKDMETMPLFATHPSVVKELEGGRHAKSSSSFLIRYQAWLFLPFYCFAVMVFWFGFFLPKKMIEKWHHGEMFLLCLHHIIFSQVGWLPYVIGLWVLGTYMLPNFALSHSHLPITKAPKHWVEYALVHTTDIEPSWFVNWWMGYLNCQIEHHLFPTMPQFRQPQVRHRVKALALKHGLPYHSCTYFEAVRKMLANLKHVSEVLHLG